MKLEKATLGTRFQNDHNGKLAVLTNINLKFKTAELTLEDGKVTSISAATFNRWWKPIQDQEEEVASDSTPYTQVMQETIQDEESLVEKVGQIPVEEVSKIVKKKNATEDKRRRGKELFDQAERLQDYTMELSPAVEIQDTSNWRPNSFNVKFAGKGIFAVVISKKGTFLYLKEFTAQENNITEEDYDVTFKKFNYPVCVAAKDNDEACAIIRKIIK